jgi:hypothetical protein
MRRFVVLALATVIAVSTSMTSANAKPRGPRLEIAKQTSAIHLVDPSFSGTLPPSQWWHVVDVRASFTGCSPSGYYYEHATLVQDGISYPWGNQALGAGEISCGGAQPNAGMAFQGDTLHVGRARASIEVVDASGAVVASDTRTVFIPEDATDT